MDLFYPLLVTDEAKMILGVNRRGKKKSYLVWLLISMPPQKYRSATHGHVFIILEKFPNRLCNVEYIQVTTVFLTKGSCFDQWNGFSIWEISISFI